MRKCEVKTVFYVFDDESQLSAADRDLLRLSREAAKAANAPYSHFSVGAALLLENGVVVKGNNQENAVFQGLCAERTAAFAASAQYPGVPFVAIAVTAQYPQNKLKRPVPPCGACRQVLNEYEKQFGRKIRVIMAGEEGEIFVSDSASQLLPIAFSDEFLSV